ncbi:sirohydrochlorin chelatase [Bacillus sp. FJAT-50079]|uniref:sirohydrochlorin chelatase n=1 Tax=Bacillus sp. FJAT-50079 TaxID=2833577 RepID=UPI001BC90F40|nr:sirohydrochlorin chelatase [Bacillus sp. FJAT-50079]MBS4209465.1 sirohydrochlorin chelatase [Bacillus sp. FJAT-50079]
MFDAIVYIGHGSRKAEGNAQFIQFVQAVMEELPYEKQAVAFLELTTPTISDTLNKLIKEGASNLLIVPVLLFSALHHKRDIPIELQEIRRKYPHISFTMTEPFGVHEYMIQLVQKRVETAMCEKNGAVLLVGRGSSDSDPIFQLKEIAKHVEQRLQIPVYNAFLTAHDPKVNQALDKLQHEYKTVYVMPYLLFTGLLLKHIERITAKYPRTAVMCNHLQFDDLMKQTLLVRIEEKRCQNMCIPS